MSITPLQVLRTAAGIAVVLALGATAHADDLAAKRAYEKATVQYNLQRFDEALTLFQRAYEEKAVPTLLFNIAQCQRQLSRYEAAARSFRAYLAQTPADDPNHDQAARLAEQMDAMARERRNGSQPASEPKPVGAKIATETKSGGIPTSAAAAPISLATVAGAPPRGRRWYNNPAGWCLGAGGIVAVGAGGALLGFAASEGSKAESAATSSDFDRHHTSDLTFQKVGWPVLGAGVAMLGVGVVLLARGAHR